MARTLYEILGVSNRASQDELRHAYRERARVLHPDHQQARGTGSSDALGADMRELNAAWRVLRDPAGRAAYDRSLAAAQEAANRSTSGWSDPDLDDEDDLDRPFRGRPAEPGDLVVALVRALPWIVIVVVLGSIFVFTAFAGHHGTDTTSPVLGDCVRSTASLEVVACSQVDALQVRDITQQTSECPTGTIGVPSARGRVLCLHRAEAPSP
ncbi:MAG TPA: J domain-containing protein [Acidimicrobiales bacterium]|jgi:curved DNA-binding protein CbpA